MGNSVDDPDDGNGTQEVETVASELHHALRAPRRRHLIRILENNHSTQVTTRYLARQIAAEEHDVTPREATGEPYRNVYNALSQTHLPTLSEAGIIIYDPQRQVVTGGPLLPLAALLVSGSDATIRTYSAFSIEDLLDPAEEDATDD